MTESLKQSYFDAKTALYFLYRAKGPSRAEQAADMPSWLNEKSQAQGKLRGLVTRMLDAGLPLIGHGDGNDPPADQGMWNKVEEDVMQMSRETRVQTAREVPRSESPELGRLPSPDIDRNAKEELYKLLDAVAARKSSSNPTASTASRSGSSATASTAVSTPHTAGELPPLRNPRCHRCEALKIKPECRAWPGEKCVKCASGKKYCTLTEETTGGGPVLSVRRSGSTSVQDAAPRPTPSRSAPVQTSSQSIPVPPNLSHAALLPPSSSSRPRLAATSSRLHSDRSLAPSPPEEHSIQQPLPLSSINPSLKRPANTHPTLPLSSKRPKTDSASNTTESKPAVSPGATSPKIKKEKGLPEEAESDDEVVILEDPPPASALANQNKSQNTNTPTTSTSTGRVARLAATHARHYSDLRENLARELPSEWFERVKPHLRVYRDRMENGFDRARSP